MATNKESLVQNIASSSLKPEIFVGRKMKRNQPEEKKDSPTFKYSGSPRKRKTILKGTRRKTNKKTFSRYLQPSSNLNFSKKITGTSPVGGHQKRNRIDSETIDMKAISSQSYYPRTIDLETKEKVIFSFTHEIKQNSFIVVPFKIALNKNALVSYNHRIDPFLVDYICL